MNEYNPITKIEKDCKFLAVYTAYGLDKIVPVFTREIQIYISMVSTQQLDLTKEKY